MGRLEVQRAHLVVIAASVFVLLVVQVAIAGGPSSSGGPETMERASVKKQLKKLKTQVKQLQQKGGELQQQINDLVQQPGPQGPQGTPGTNLTATCEGNDPSDVMVAAGSVCIDRYEASVWSSPTGGTQYGVSSDNYPCNDNGQNCTNIYARSVAGVTPSRFITYFQAQQALANSGKTLPTNAEWQQTVAGTPDPHPPGPEDCDIASAGVDPTGSFDNCISNHGANDMVGNLWEWVGDWDEEGVACANWPAMGFGSDASCLGRANGEASTRFPGVLIRGGDFGLGAAAGPFAVTTSRPSDSPNFIGFRGVR